MLDASAITHIVFSAVFFVVVWAVLAGRVFKPFLSVLEEREGRTVGDEKSAREKREQAKALQAKIEDELKQTRIRAIQERDQQVQVAKKQGEEILADAAAEVEKRMLAARADIASVKQAAEVSVEEEAQKLAGLVVARVLDGGSAATVH